jgi:hypothetical protein
MTVPVCGARYIPCSPERALELLRYNFALAIAGQCFPCRVFAQHGVPLHPDAYAQLGTSFVRVCEDLDWGKRRFSEWRSTHVFLDVNVLIFVGLKWNAENLELVLTHQALRKLL